MICICIDAGKRGGGQKAGEGMHFSTDGGDGWQQDSTALYFGKRNQDGLRPTNARGRALDLNFVRRYVGGLVKFAWNQSTGARVLRVGARGHCVLSCVHHVGIHVARWGVTLKSTGVELFAGRLYYWCGGLGWWGGGHEGRW
jgi:hypothetical protein